MFCDTGFTDQQPERFPEELHRDHLKHYSLHSELCTVKIYVDKIEGGPPHALTKHDVRLVFETVPRDWTKDIKVVRIANSLEWRSHTFFARYDGSLTIYSRNKTQVQALAALLSELAAVSLRLDRGLRYRPKAIRNHLEKMTAPFMHTLLPLLAPPREVNERVSFKGFKELRFPFVPNDID